MEINSQISSDRRHLLYINQNDDKERNHQVKMMGEFYRNAKKSHSMAWSFDRRQRCRDDIHPKRMEWNRVLRAP